MILRSKLGNSLQSLRRCSYRGFVFNLGSNGQSAGSPVTSHEDLQHNAEGRLSDDSIKDNRGQTISDL